MLLEDLEILIDTFSVEEIIDCLNICISKKDKNKKIKLVQCFDSNFCIPSREYEIYPDYKIKHSVI